MKQNSPFKFTYIFLVGLFYLGLTLVAKFPIMSNIIRIAGIGIVAIYVLFVLEYRQSISTEIVMFIVFLAWAGISGTLVSINKTDFRDLLLTLVQILILMVAVSGFVKLFGSIKAILLIVLVSVIIVDVFILFSGGFDIPKITPTSARVTSFNLNPNVFAIYNLLGAFVLLFLSYQPKNGIRNLFGILLLLCFLFCIIMSASQKAFFAFVVLIASWFWFCLRKNIPKSKQFLYFLLIILILSLSFYFAVNNTYLGTRMQYSAIGEDGSLIVRMTLYKEGWRTFLEHPITGVGLANFKYYSSFQLYSHADFLEVLSTTGIIGLIFYASAYIILWKRMVTLYRADLSVEEKFQVGALKSFFFTFIFIGIARINFTSIETMFVIASIIGYITYLEVTTKKSVESNRLLLKR